MKISFVPQTFFPDENQDFTLKFNTKKLCSKLGTKFGLVSQIFCQDQNPKKIRIGILLEIVIPELHFKSRRHLPIFVSIRQLLQKLLCLRTRHTDE